MSFMCCFEYSVVRSSLTNFEQAYEFQSAFIPGVVAAKNEVVSDARTSAKIGRRNGGYKLIKEVRFSCPCRLRVRRQCSSVL